MIILFFIIVFLSIINDMIDKIIVTGCSHSTGIEMLDHLIDYPSEKNRRLAIWKWYKKNYQTKNKKTSILELNDKSNDIFHAMERQESWPKLLEKKTNIPVTNLSIAGASIGRSLIEFSNWCKIYGNKEENNIVIHQLPQIGRFYLRFSEYRANVYSNIVFTDLKKLGYGQEYYKNDLEKLKQKYHEIIQKDVEFNYIKKHYHRCLKRMIRLGLQHNIRSFFISIKDIEVENSILKDFDAFRNKYKKGKMGHPTDPIYNEDLVKLIRSKLFV
jgi:hypothetical protein